MRIALVCPQWEHGRTLPSGLRDPDQLLFEPAHLLGLRAIAQAAGHYCEIFVNDGVAPGIDGLCAGLLDFRPDVVGLSFIFDGFPKTVEWRQALVAWCRQQTYLTLLGGAEPTDDVYGCLRRYPELDIIVQGPGETAFEHLVAARFDPGTLLGAQQHGSTMVLKVPLGLHAIRTVPYQRPYDLGEYRGIAMIRTNDGCIGGCNFCNAELSLRTRTAGDVVEELRYLREQGSLRYFYYSGRDFTTKPLQANEILRALLAAEDLHGLPIFLLCRVDTLAKAVELDADLWVAFSKVFPLEISVGLESMLAERRERLGKAQTLVKAEQQGQQLNALLKVFVAPRSRLNTEFILFDPQSTRWEVAVDLIMLALQSAAYWPHFGLRHLTILANRLMVYPETIFAAQYPDLVASFDEILAYDPRQYFKNESAPELLDYARCYLVRVTRQDNIRVNLMMDDPEARALFGLRCMFKYIQALLNIFITPWGEGRWHDIYQAIEDDDFETIQNMYPDLTLGAKLRRLMEQVQAEKSQPHLMIDDNSIAVVDRMAQRFSLSEPTQI